MTTTLDLPRSNGGSLALLSGAAAFLAGLLTAFTISVGGEMPVGEIVLSGVFGWIVLCSLVTGSLPPELPRTKLFRALMVCQLIAFLAYVFSDFYRHSTTHDMMRGWARMVFLAIDVISVAYLFGCTKVNLLIFMTGSLLGDSVHAVLFGALFGDLWKFGVGVPITFLVFFLAALVGRPVLVASAFVMCVVHFVLDYRSYGGLCLVVGTATMVTLFPRKVRLWLLLPAFFIVVAGIGTYVVHHQDAAQRSNRSDISRSSMMKAALIGFKSSPLIGQGSWFSRSNVFTNFVLIRAEAAKLAHIGGFPDVSEDPGSVAIHSQILVALAEGGVFGASFFLIFGGALVAAIYRLTFVLEGTQFTGLYLLILGTALFNWFLSPFSGAHRVYIAVACGLLLFLARSRPRQPGAPAL